MLRVFAVLAAMAAAQVVHADQETQRQHEAHVHGVATLNMVLENQQLAIEFESPADNILGFEHQPGNTEQQQTLDNAKAALHDATRLFGLPAAADCQLANAAVEWSLDQAEGEQESHSEFHVLYAFNCESPDALGFVDVLLFERFPEIEEIEAQVIGPRGQSAFELTVDSARIEL